MDSLRFKINQSRVHTARQLVGPQDFSLCCCWRGFKEAKLIWLHTKCQCWLVSIRQPGHKPALSSYQCRRVNLAPSVFYWPSTEGSYLTISDGCSGGSRMIRHQREEQSRVLCMFSNHLCCSCTGCTHSRSTQQACDIYHVRSSGGRWQIKATCCYSCSFCK